MALRVGFLGVAHMHADSYASTLSRTGMGEISGVWDRNPETATSFANRFSVPVQPDPDALLAGCDCVIIASENRNHVVDVTRAVNAGKPVLCEKPLVTTREEAEALRGAVGTGKAQFMTAFPCRFSPAFQRLAARVRAGDIGTVVGISATNRGTCPFGWFTEPELSGGGAMIDHVVHVADLLVVLLGEHPKTVAATMGSNMYGKEWDDSALLSLQFPSGVFATLDASWSRPKSYKTWGDVTMTVVGESGVLELDLFAQSFDHFRNEATPSHRLRGFGSDLDGLLVKEFVSAVSEGRAPSVGLEEGLAASMVAIAGYESVGTQTPVSPT